MPITLSYHRSEAEELNEFAIALPFITIDAAMLEVLRKSPQKFGVQLDYRRTALSTGSVEYHLFGTGKSEKRLRIGTIFVCAQDDRLTYIDTSPNDRFSSEEKTLIQGTLNTIVYYSMFRLHDHQAYTQELLKEMPALSDDNLPEPKIHLAMTSGSTKTGSHQSWPEDDWAWDQVNLHQRPRMAVREEWMQRLSPDRTLRDKPGSFRHAVNRERKGKRKAGT